MKEGRLEPVSQGSDSLTRIHFSQETTLGRGRTLVLSNWAISGMLRPWQLSNLFLWCLDFISHAYRCNLILLQRALERWLQAKEELGQGLGRWKVEMRRNFIIAESASQCSRITGLQGFIWAAECLTQAPKPRSSHMSPSARCQPRSGIGLEAARLHCLCFAPVCLSLLLASSPFLWTP